MIAAAWPTPVGLGEQRVQGVGEEAVRQAGAGEAGLGPVDEQGAGSEGSRQGSPQVLEVAHVAAEAEARQVATRPRAADLAGHQHHEGPGPVDRALGPPDLLRGRR